MLRSKGVYEVHYKRLNKTFRVEVFWDDTSGKPATQMSPLRYDYFVAKPDGSFEKAFEVIKGATVPYDFVVRA